MAAIDEFLDGLMEIEPEVPQSFTWNGQEYPCFASGATRGGKLEHFGWGIDDDLVIIVRAAVFGEDGPFPKKEETVLFRDITYRIDRALTAPESAFIRLACVNASRGA